MCTKKRVRDGHCVIGLVASLDDPDKLGRVQVTFPYLDNEKSEWARLVSPMAGNGRGLFLRPEVGDEVLVAFEFGDPRRPYVLGGLWSKEDKHPADDGEPKQNNWRFLQSRSGHIIRLDDTKGKEKIEIIAKGLKHKITIDPVKAKIRVECESGDVEVMAKSGNVQIEAKTLTIKATGAINIQAGADLVLKGATVKIN